MTHMKIFRKIKKEDRYPLLCLIVFLGTFILAAIKPLFPRDWLLESLLTVITVSILVMTYKKYKFSNISYTFITLFLILHTIGSHYTYSNVPFGFWLQDVLGLSRNHYDRIIHFLFGLFIYLPIRELVQKISNSTSQQQRLFSYVVPVLIITSFGALFEILEWLAASIVDPELGIAYLGTQGDVWDAQKDMVLKIISSLIAAAFFYAKENWRGSKFP